MFKEILLVMCFVALTTLVIAQPVDNFEAAAVETNTNQMIVDNADGSNDLVGAENRFGYGGYGGYGGELKLNLNKFSV